ncbi:MAG: hypothetical protein KDA86_08765 [Planctomycetaceae bacterium]|nr:hypothetical protein [Planctomycetaceae bacterium]
MSNSEKVVELLQTTYMMELETVANYLANSIHLDGVQAEEIKRALAGDITEELGHAQRLAERLKQLDGRIPGSLDLERSQELLQPPEDTTNVEAVVDGVIEAEADAIAHYRKIIEATEGSDFVTQDLVIAIMADEEHHHRQFEGFRAGYQSSLATAG